MVHAVVVLHQALVAADVKLASCCRGYAGDVVVEYRHRVDTAVIVVCEVVAVELAQAKFSGCPDESIFVLVCLLDQAAGQSSAVVQHSIDGRRGRDNSDGYTKNDAANCSFNLNIHNTKAG